MKQTVLEVLGCIAAAVSVIAMLGAAFVYLQKDETAAPELSEEVKTGIAYIQAHDSGDISSVQETLKTLKQAKIDQANTEKINQVIQGLDSDPDSVWSMFDDYMLLGDSRAMGFTYYNYLPESKCITEGGANIRTHLEVYLDTIYSRAPSYIYLCYGLNDVSIGYWNSPEEYCSEFRDVLDSIRRNLPDATVVISSILIARDPAFDRSEKWRKIPEYNTALKAMCDDFDYVYYADNTEICDQYASFWQQDGIHVGRGFYAYWAKNLIIQTLKSQIKAASAS